MLINAADLELRATGVEASIGVLFCDKGGCLKGKKGYIHVPVSIFKLVRSLAILEEEIVGSVASLSPAC